uniref:remorin 4.2-like n=1 Tax=Erigeron canadensis TaxID=72917 RepID=UPI001CB947E5|nr:remorin 4.2-like [Erigeron canadensis]
MSNYLGGVTSARSVDDQNSNNINGEESFTRDIHALTPTSSIISPPPPIHHRLASSLSIATSDDFSTTNNSTLVVAGSTVDGGSNRVIEELDYEVIDDLGMMLHDPNNNSLSPPPLQYGRNNQTGVLVPAVSNVKKEEVEWKISAWKNAKIAEITNRFKCEDAIIKGWENEQVQKATLKMKQVERKLEEKKARAMEKMENEIAKAHQKAEEKRASEESKRGTKIARVLEVANLMKAVGRSPVKNFF